MVYGDGDHRKSDKSKEPNKSQSKSNKDSKDTVEAFFKGYLYNESLRSIAKGDFIHKRYETENKLGNPKTSEKTSKVTKSTRNTAMPRLAAR